MVKAQHFLWVSGAALLLAPTLWLIYFFYFSPPAYISTTKMMLSGKLVVSPEPMPSPSLAARAFDSVHRDDLIAVAVLVLLYLPGVMLLLVAALRARRIRAATPTI